jgi:predicted amidohydrolase YtcJ
VRNQAQFHRALTAANPGDDGWIRAIGYHESVAGDLDRARLDALRPTTPMRIQHRSGVLWILNSAALARIGLADHPDGRLRSADGWDAALPRRNSGLAALSGALSGYGVTGVTDATPDLSADDCACLTTELAQRVACLAPGKIILHDDRLDLEELARWIGERHADGRIIAVHCVTTAQLVVTVAALRAAGTRPGDRIEHAAMVPEENLADLADLGVTVVTQPNFLAERGEQYDRDIAPDEKSQLWRLASLMAAGIPVAGSTDAPFGNPDPWAAMRAAVKRPVAERVSPLDALRLFLGTAERPALPRTVAPAQPGDLCVLRVPPHEALRTLASDLVATTIIAGAVVGG